MFEQIKVVCYEYHKVIIKTIKKVEILVNTDNNVEGTQKMKDYVRETVDKNLDRFKDVITRVEVHFSDQNGNKKGPKDKKCVIEARLKGMSPIAVSSQEDDIHKAVAFAIDKVKASLNTTVGKMKEH